MEKFSILLVDDVEQNIYSLKMMIEDSFDSNIYTSSSAKDAMSLLMNNDIDLILTDIQMPEIDGFEFVEYLKGIEKTKNIPVIFITGIYDKDNYKKRGYNLGAIEYIAKPIDDLLLTSKLKVYIDIFDENKKNKSELNRKDEVLIHQSKMATMGEMIGVIAHQLKQPLNAISLYCGDIKESYEYNEIDQSYVNEFNDNTKEQVSFMNDTINGFIDFFNPNKEKRSFLLKEAVNKTQHLLNKQLLENNINITLNLSNEEVYGVETELEQVFINLITNSKDAFIENNIKNREIEITSIEKDNNIIIIVQDNAGGVNSDDINTIFDPYFTTKTNGTGTGLYMVQLVIKVSFKGELKVQNSKSGLKFIISLPKNSI